MQFINDDPPLGEQFLANPLQFMQNYVRNMNNEMFLSEYHINHLYALLLIGRSSPWDTLKPASTCLKKDVDQIVQRKVKDVNFILQNLSQLYQEKMKKGALNQIEKLMSIIKAKNKSIYINKAHSNRRRPHYHHHHHCHSDKVNAQKHDIEHKNEQACTQQGNTQMNNMLTPSQNLVTSQSCECENSQSLQKEKGNSIDKQQGAKFQQEKDSNTQRQKRQQTQVEKITEQEQEQPSQQVFGLFYGLANLGNISAMAMNAGQFLQYNPVQKFIRFKMSKSYFMTIKNEDPSYFDSVSLLKDVPSDLMTHHIFPYLTATQLFSLRAVSKQWMDNVKDAWHATFKREMFNQLLACEFCKDIQFFYKLIQLRNPFFQKISLLLHALIQIIQWETVYEAVASNTVSLQLKRVLIVLLKLLGQHIQLHNLNDITDIIWNLHKEKVMNLKMRVTQFFNNFSGNTNLSVNDLRQIKMQLLDNPFMRVQEMQTEDKTPLLLSIFIKQLTLQQILRCHIFFSQQYLLNSKKRLDSISVKMPQQRGYLEGVYKILLLRNMKSVKEEAQDQKSQMPNFQELLQSIFNRQQSDKPDFVIRGKKSITNIFMDKATKLDIIVSTVRKINLSSQGQNGQEKEGSKSQALTTQENEHGTMGNQRQIEIQTQGLSEVRTQKQDNQVDSSIRQQKQKNLCLASKVTSLEQCQNRYSQQNRDKKEEK